MKKGPKPENMLFRFWKKIDKNGIQVSHMPTRCWKWLGNKHPFGYGITSLNGKRISAHRKSYIIHIGPIPEGLLVLHKCDNPECCNPEHLFSGTHSDNSKDMVSKNRQRKNYDIDGEKNPAAKLTTEQVLQIRELACQKVHQGQIADAFGVSLPLVEKIIARKVWSHI